MGVLAGSRIFEASKLQAARASKISLVARRGLREDETLSYVRFGSKADITAAQTNVRFVPQADSCAATKSPSLNHIVCSGEHCSRYGNTERFAGLEIDV